MAGKLRRTIVSGAVASLALVGLGAVPAQAAEISIPDPGLKACINDYFGRAADAPITDADVPALMSLGCNPGATGAIATLDGVENFTQLRSVDLGFTSGSGGVGNSFSDLTPLSKLPNLESFATWNTKVSDLSPLAGMPNLVELVVRSSSVTDMTPVLGLSKLAFLDLRNNRITSVPDLTVLPDLRRLYLNQNLITDGSPLKKLVDSFPDRFGEVYATDQGWTGATNLGFAWSNANLGAVQDPNAVYTAINGKLTVTAQPGIVTSDAGTKFEHTTPGQKVIRAGASYTNPNGSFGGYSVRIVQSGIARATTLQDDSLVVKEGEQGVIDVLANDGAAGEPALDPATLALVDGSGASVSSLTVAEGLFEVVSGKIEFTPAAGFVGAVPAVKYRVTNVDGEIGEASIAVTVDAKDAGASAGASATSSSDSTASATASSSSNASASSSSDAGSSTGASSSASANAAGASASANGASANTSASGSGASATASGKLATTGADGSWISAGLGAVALLAGGLVLVLRRRGRTDRMS